MPNILELLLGQLMGRQGQPQGTPPFNPNATSPGMPGQGGMGQGGQMPPQMPGQTPQYPGTPPTFPGQGGPQAPGGQGFQMPNLMQLLPMLMAAKGGGQTMGSFAQSRNTMQQQEQQRQQQGVENQQRQQQIDISSRQADIAKQQADASVKESEENILTSQTSRAEREAEALADSGVSDYSQLSPETQSRITPARFKAVQGRRKRMNDLEKLTHDAKRLEAEGYTLDIEAKKYAAAVRQASSVIAGQVHKGEAPDYSKLNPDAKKVFSEEEFMGEYETQKSAKEMEKLSRAEILERIASSSAKRQQDKWIQIGYGVFNPETKEIISPQVRGSGVGETSKEDMALIMNAQRLAEGTIGQANVDKLGDAGVLGPELTKAMQQILINLGRPDLAEKVTKIGFSAGEKWWRDDEPSVSIPGAGPNIANPASDPLGLF